MLLGFPSQKYGFKWTTVQEQRRLVFAAQELSAAVQNSEPASWPVLAAGASMSASDVDHSAFNSDTQPAEIFSDNPKNECVRAFCCIPAHLYSCYSQVYSSELKRLKSAAESNFLGRYCARLSARNVSGQLGAIDKQFAVAWLDDQTVAWGTKCNKLLVHNLWTGAVRRVPLVPVPETEARPRERKNIYGKCGMHAVAINPSRTLLACGGHNPNDIMLYSLPDFKPVKTFLGHEDWVFGLNWLSDEHLASGGRDGRMKLWTVKRRHESLYKDTKCTRTIVIAKRAKVRESSYCWHTRELLALDPEGFVRQVDTATWKVAAEWCMPDNHELICMTTREHLVAAGTERNLVLLDTRARTPIQGGAETHSCSLLAEHPDREGLRSVRINKNIISCGGSYGTLTFYDLAAGKWVEGNTPKPAVLHAGPASCLNPSEPQRNIQDQLVLEGHDYMKECAVYCQDWDPSGKMLVTGGGPLAIGLQGCYGSLWT